MARTDADWYDYPQYYDMAFRSETKQEVDFFEDAFKKYCSPPVRRIVEPACGSGRLVAELSARGYEVTGFDLSEPSLRYLRSKLRRRGLSAEVFHQDMTDFQLARPMDAAVNTWNTFRHLLSENAARSHLRSVARCLRPGGIYILGLHLLRLDVDEECTERWSARHGGTKVTVTLRVTATDRSRRREDLRVSLRVRSGERDLRLRHDFSFRMYTADQFRDTIDAVDGLELINVYDFWFDIDEPLQLDDEITDTIFILRKT